MASQPYDEADSRVPRIIRLIQEAFAEGARMLGAQELLRALTGQLSSAGMLAETIWSQSGGLILYGKVREELEDLLTVSAAQEVPVMAELLTRPVVAELEAAFNVVDERVISVIRQQGATQIVGIDLRTRAGIRATLEEALRQGLGPQKVQEQLMQQIGLTDQQAKTLARFRALLVEEQGDGPDTERAVQARTKQMKLQRAETIARTETITASNQGRQLYWEELARQNILPPGEYRRWWQVSRDERLCKVCQEVPKLNPRGVAMTEAFKTPVGLVMYPALHVNCRCTVTLRANRRDF